MIRRRETPEPFPRPPVAFVAASALLGAFLGARMAALPPRPRQATAAERMAYEAQAREAARWN